MTRKTTEIKKKVAPPKAVTDQVTQRQAVAGTMVTDDLTGRQDITGTEEITG